MKTTITLIIWCIAFIAVPFVSVGLQYLLLGKAYQLLSILLGGIGGHFILEKLFDHK